MSVEYFTSWKLADLEGKYVLNEEVNNAGARSYFGFNKQKDAWDWYVKNKGRCLYETITYPCKLFCDIDHETDVDKIINHIIEQYPSAIPIIQTKGDDKPGTHIIFDKTKADSPDVLRAAFNGCDVDMSVYGKNRCLRMEGSPKYGKPHKGIYSGDNFCLISIGTIVPETRNAPIKKASTVKEKREMTTFSRIFSNVFGQEVEVWGSDPEEVNFEIRLTDVCPKCNRKHNSTTLRQFIKVNKSNNKIWYRCPRNTSNKPIFVGVVELNS